MRDDHLTRRDILKAAIRVAAVGLTGSSVAASAKPAPTYAELLDHALVALETGKHPLAVGPLKAALTLDRNEPTGLLALGTLYFHTGSFARASAEFDRARSLAPDDSLIAFASALADLALRKDG